MMMKIVLLCLAVAAFAAAEDVITLTEANFDSVVNREEMIVVEFYAPWCGHCKNLAPEYEKAAGVLKRNDPPIKLAKVDATEEPALGSRFGVKGYPTLKIFRKGQASDYEGPRDAEGIVSYIAKQAGPASKPIDSVAKLHEKLAKATDIVILGLFTEANSAKFSTFTSTANQLRDSYQFAESTDPAVLAEVGVSDAVVIALPTSFKSKSEQMFKSTTDVTSSVTLKKWIEDNHFPLVGLLSQATMPRYQAASKPVVTLWANIDFERDAKTSNYIANRLRKVAKDFDNFVFSVSDIRGGLASALSGYGVNANDVYAVTIKGVRGEKYVFTGLTGQTSSFKTDGLDQFLQQVVKGEIEQYLKSEAVPAKATVAGVTTLVGKNFDTEITDDKPALIEFYAPWCGHCKSLAPTWDELGRTLEGEEVVIAKMDATANDSPSDYEVRGFPTIYFKPAGGVPEKYQGGRDLKDFVSFLGERVKLSKSHKEL